MDAVTHIAKTIAAMVKRRLDYFDTALSSSSAALPTRLAFAKPGHVLFGSDWPFAPSTGVGLFAGMLDVDAGLDDAGHAAINRGPAERLFPQFGVQKPHD